MKKFTNGNPIFHTYVAFLRDQIILCDLTYISRKHSGISPISYTEVYCGDIIVKYNNTKIRK